MKTNQTRTLNMTPLPSLALIASCLLSGCGDLPVSQTSDIVPNAQDASAYLSSVSLPLSGEHAVLVHSKTANYWLSANPEQGLNRVMVAGNGQPETTTLYTHPVEFLDTRTRTLESGDTQHRTITLNQKNQLVMIHSLNDNNTLSISQPLPWAIEGLCLYQPDSEPLQLFILDDNALAHQLLLSTSDNALNTTDIRRFSLPPGAEYCTVDDQSGALFVSEDNVGVWAYNARAESDVRRTPVDLVAPWGELKDNAGPVAVTNGHLLVGEKDSRFIHQYRIHADNNDITTQPVRSYSLATDIAIDGLNASVRENGNAVTAVILNDDDGSLHRFSLNIKPTKQTTDDLAYVPATAETDAVATPGDAADDPAIWVHPSHPEKSRILGTNKKQGLLSYDLSGAQMQLLPVGRVNNVDVRQGFTLKGQPMDIAAASQRDRNTIALFSLHPSSGKMTAAGEISTHLNHVYGLCMYQNRQNDVFVFINDQDGRYEQYQILDSEQGWTGKLARVFAVESQPEGCAADDRNQRLFVGEENHGIWTLNAEPDTGNHLKEVTNLRNSSALFADIEGMDIYQTDDQNLLVVSSQGNDSYVFFNADAPYEYLGRMRVGMNPSSGHQHGVDGASETDGLTVTSANLGAQYPNGLLVVQDGRNLMPNEEQNFKLVDWRSITEQLPSLSSANTAQTP